MDKCNKLQNAPKAVFNRTPSSSTTSSENDIDADTEPHHIKSKAIVKFSAVQVPINFARLQCNTNLNMPPSNWLSNSANSYGLQQTTCNTTGFSSFQMAHTFPDCVGEVDVVSAAENIKHLLKLPYSPKSAISMMVHRIENTLLIDDFDIHKYLLRQSNEDWQWLRSFLFENILKSLSEKDLNFFMKNKSRDFLQQKNLISKFLYYSLKENDEETINEMKAHEAAKINSELITKLNKSGPVLPEPNMEENLPDPHKLHTYNRNVVWTFEDIRMLIGTDMPIFGGGTRPCISLKLRDMSKPINVLTGIDYWLDNLMCNVPEVVMCYHLDGIVQKYELIKTEDLPNLENSKFSPRVIRNVAQNILSFLKANATKSGHTYWLFKGRNDDVVKLYDLTTLCADTADTHRTDDQDAEEGEDETNKKGNPFTVPVAMLLYTVARNMKNSSEKITARKAGSIKVLLDNCIKLLPKEKYPQIVTSSYYLLSDLQVPAEIDPGSPDFSSSPETDDDESVYDENCEYESPPNDSQYDENIAVKVIQEAIEEYNLEENWKHNSTPPPLVGSIKERCEMALKNIACGLNCLQYFNLTEDKYEKEEEKKRIRQEEENPIMARPSQPIPLPYQTLRKDDKASETDKPSKPANEKKRRKGGKAEKQSSKEEEESSKSLLFRGTRSWNVHLKLLLLEKTCLTYATLAEDSYSAENYGRALRYIYAALKCQQIVTNTIATVASQKSCLLGRAGDCFFQFAKNWNDINSYLKEFKIESETDKLISHELFKDIGTEIESQLPLPLDNIEQLMRTSCACYEAALESATEISRAELLRRLGSVRNEMGVKYMHWAQEEYNKEMGKISTSEPLGPVPDNCQKDVLYQTLACKSYDSLTKGITAFEEVKDATNLAFLLCNMGRFMRFRAHIHLPGETPNNHAMQKKFYTESFTYYNRALGILGSRKHNPELWDLVNWELSTATFTLAKQMQDGTEKLGRDIDEIEAEVIEILKKSLKLCDVETPGQRQILYQFRSAVIQHRLASFYHHQYRTCSDESRRKTVLQLCRLHYEKSAKILENLQEGQEYLQVQLERIGLQEYQSEHATSPQIKLRHLQNGLDLILQAQSIVNFLATAKSLENENEINSLLVLFEQRLQVILRSLTKLCLTKKVENHEKLASMYKKSYAITLSSSKHENFNMLAGHLDRVIGEVKKL